jgi:hypothetical protein
MMFISQSVVFSQVLSATVAQLIRDGGRHNQPLLLLTYKKSGCLKCDLEIQHACSNFDVSHPNVFIAILVQAGRIIEAKKMIREKIQNLAPKAICIPDDGDFVHSCHLPDIEPYWAFFSSNDSLLRSGSISSGLNESLLPWGYSQNVQLPPQLRLIESVAIHEDSSTILTSISPNSKGSNDLLGVADRTSNKAYTISMKTGQINETIEVSEEMLHSLLSSGETFVSDHFAERLGNLIIVEQFFLTKDTNRYLIYGTVYVQQKDENPNYTKNTMAMYRKPFLLEWSKKDGAATSLTTMKSVDNPALCQDALMLDSLIFLGQERLSFDEKTEELLYDSMFTVLVWNFQTNSGHFEEPVEPFYKALDFGPSYLGTSFVLVNGKIFTVQSLGSAIHVHGTSTQISIAQDHYIYPGPSLLKQLDSISAVDSNIKHADIIRQLKVKNFIFGMICLQEQYIGLYYLSSDNISNKRIPYGYYMHIYDTLSGRFVTNLTLPIDYSKKETLVKVVHPRKDLANATAFTILVKNADGYRFDTYSVENL